MTDKDRNDLFYVCSLIEYIGRITKNKRGAIIRYIGYEGIQKLLHDAEVNHCLSFEQVGDEIIEQYEIRDGDFDTITGCKYTVPGYIDIGRLYSIMIEDCVVDKDVISEMMNLFQSFISDEISNFNTDLYYQNPSYLECSYQAGCLLD